MGLTFNFHDCNIQVNDNNKNLITVYPAISVSGGIHNEVGHANLNPQPGMTFNTVDAVKDFYRIHGMQQGFDTKIRNSKKGADGNVRYMVLYCAREGGYVSDIPLEVKTCPSKRVQCPARINVNLVDGVWTITSVIDVNTHDISPAKGRPFRGNKKISLHVQRKLQINDDVGVRLNKSFRSLVHDAGGHGNLTFVERDIRAFVNKQRKCLGKGGDGKALLTYFANMRDRNFEFFYDIDLDDDFQVRHVFWVDARCRAAYESFDDVVSFDTTYLTNKYDMPFTTFVGVNHHGQSTLLGCGLLSSEDTTSFVWLFKTWLRCMSFVPPQAIIIDQCQSIKCAIEVVFPTIRHRWCQWYIMKKISDKFKGLKDYNNIKHCMKDVVYGAKTKNDFEVKWNTFIAKFALDNNDWLSTLYNERHRWVPCILKDSFWARMSTTQRSESMNAFFDGYIHSTTSLHQFVSQYDNALQHKIKKEYEADFHSLNTAIRCGSHSILERQFQLLYTHAKFAKLQVEFRANMNCSVVSQELIYNKLCYNIMEETMTNETAGAEFEQVTFHKITSDFTCTYKLFEFKGIICRHSLVVLANERVIEVPRKYIMEQWCKNVKRRHTYINTVVTTHNKQPRNDRFEKLCKKFYQVTEYAFASLEKTNCLMKTLNYFENGLGELYHSPTADKSEKNIVSSHDMDFNDVEIHSPVRVARKGRPRTARNQREK